MQYGKGEKNGAVDALPFSRRGMDPLPYDVKIGIKVALYFDGALDCKWHRYSYILVLLRDMMVLSCMNSVLVDFMCLFKEFVSPAPRFIIRHPFCGLPRNLQRCAATFNRKRTRKEKQGKFGVNFGGQVRSGMGAYAGAARRRVHLAPVLLRPPSGHRPGRRQARHARIPQI